MTEIEQRDARVQVIGRELAKVLPGLYGNVQFNLQDGKLVHFHVLQTHMVKPEPSIRAGKAYELDDRKSPR